VRFSTVEELTAKPRRTKEEAALLEEFEAFKKNASLPMLFELLAQDLKREMHCEQRSSDTNLKEHSAKAKPLSGRNQPPQDSKLLK